MVPQDERRLARKRLQSNFLATLKRSTKNPDAQEVLKLYSSLPTFSGQKAALLERRSILDN